MRLCSIEGCGRRHYGKGYCHMHYRRQAKGNDPRVAQPRNPATPIQLRFWAKVDVRGPDECWLWTAGVNPYGYGAFWVRGVMRGAHRVSYEMAVGPIPDELQLDHICRVRRCVNPSHLEPVTQLENLRREASARRTGVR
jgi:hypothetical protein